MADIVDCPKCGGKLRVPDELVGRTVKCPTCGSLFIAAITPQRANEQPARGLDAPLRRADQHEEKHGEPSASSGARRPCPHCGKENPSEHTACNHCGAVFEDQLAVVSDDEPPIGRHATYRGNFVPHRGGLILCLGILSILFGLTGILGVIGLALGICSWVMGQKDLQRIRNREMDARGDGLTHSGWICGIVGVVVSTVVSFCCCGGFVFFPPRGMRFF